MKNSINENDETFFFFKGAHPKVFKKTRISAIWMNFSEEMVFEVPFLSMHPQMLSNEPRSQKINTAFQNEL